MFNHSFRAAVLFNVCLLCSSALGIETLWTFHSPLGGIDSTPAVADVAREGQPKVVLTTTGGMVIGLDANGKQLWMQGIQIPISVTPTLADMVEGPEPEILMLNQSGSVYCLSGRAGSVIWRHDLPSTIAWGSTAIAVADVDGDGQKEAIVGDRDGHVVCLSPQGEEKWKFDGPQGSTLCPAVGPIGEGKSPLILISGSKMPLVCLNGKGKEQWRVDKGGSGSSPVLADINGDGKNEIITGAGYAVIAVDGNGKVLWEHPMKKELDSSLCVADANEDGVVEIYGIDMVGHVAAISPAGKTLWTAEVRERSRRSPTIGDVDGDGTVEIVVAGYSHELYLFTPQGELKESHPLPAVSNSSPVIADLKGDGSPVVLCATIDGNLTAYRWAEAKPNAKVLWPQYRFGNTRTGLESKRVRSPAQIRSIDFGRYYVGENEIAATIENPEARPLKVITTIATDGGKRRIQTREGVDKLLPINVKYTLTDVTPTTIQIECSVHEGDTVVAQRTDTAYVVPFKKEIADLEASLAKVKQAASAIPDGYDFLGQVAACEARVPEYKSQAAVAGTLEAVQRRGLRDALRKELGRFAVLEKLARVSCDQFAKGRWPLRLSVANPWAPFGRMDEVQEDRLCDADLCLEAFSGEVEGAALNVFNFGVQSVAARVEVDDFTLEGSTDKTAVLARDVTTLHEVVDVPTQMADSVADALPRMNQANVITLPQRDARQLWLNIDTKRLKPGKWKSVVRLRTLEAESKEFTAPITVTVWTASLPDKQPLHHCNWGYVEGSRHKYYEDETIKDRVAHGNNVFTCTFVPLAKFDEKGRIVGDIDYKQHDEFVKKYSPHGMILFQMTGGISGPGGRETEAYRKAYIAWMTAWVQHLKDMGITYDRYAMYPVDEPGLSDGLVKLYLDYAKLTREADSKVLMYTDPVYRITEEELREMLPYVDIWCPNRNGFLLDLSAEKFAIIKNSGKQVWTYECDGNAKHLSPLGYYRGQSWLVWRHGLTGIGFWTYCTSPEDPWFKSNVSPDYLMTYQGDSVVSTKRWEAVRDGVEDYSMLTVLRDKAAKARADSKKQEAIKKADALLGERAFAIAKFCNNRDVAPTNTGMPGARKQADEQRSAIQQVRREIAAALNELSQ